ncbi:GNAT family N-acetyltransferase [Streptomyces sp. NBC_00893]|uniref:GNAT family N-acetyltransferase n=1 Tax=Streptomyces sp. NBC_00893 TaxID=2975862 RepID=UPI00224E939A|nr:GNAT family N-acetyltransferase [Streptomyces sp. NBC_00893]MCX4849174.1 GNAT family N-acetyltransferase [Streptomyces sp. NBC_00893]
MTTTLRPTGPIQQGADGAQIRAYDVCDNGRPVGAVEIGTDPGFGTKAGVLRSLHIDESRRRRGRGTIAALAAEEVLRGWGCTRMTVMLPADDPAGHALATTLGYAERSRNMVKQLEPAPPALPDGVSARPMTEEEFARWERDAITEYAQTWIERGVPADQAMRKAETSHAQNLPHGLATEGTHLHVLMHEGEAVGLVWVARYEMHPGMLVGYVFDVEVRAEFRGRGFGRALMLQAERIAIGAGDDRMGLHVLASNTPALRLYESLGYRTTRYNFAKNL